MNIIFMGSPVFAIPTLQKLIESQHDVIAVYSQPPRVSGRGHKQTPTPVYQLAEENNIPVFTPASLKNESEQKQFSNLKADVAIVAAYGLLLPQAILDGTKYGCINIHPSSLPRWRGAAPINRTIMAGDKTTEVCIMKMDKGLDTGDVYLRQKIEIHKNMTAGELHDICADIGANLTLKVLEEIENLVPSPQQGQATYADKISKNECQISWQKNADELCNLINGLSPFPGAYFYAGNVRIKTLKVSVVDAKGKIGQVLDDNLTIACGDKAIRVLQVQREGKKPQASEEFVKGFKLTTGQQLQ